jgi:hypothetical protein
MSGEEVCRLLQRGIGQPLVALECRCANLETVYVSLTKTDKVLVGDQGKTFAYLDLGTDSAHLPVEEIDMDAAEGVCRRPGALLVCDYPEAYPRIECVVIPAGSVAEAVERVAEAVDGVFQLALRDHLK